MFALWLGALALAPEDRRFAASLIARRCGLGERACRIALHGLRRQRLAAADGDRFCPTIAGFGRIAEIVDLDAALRGTSLAPPGD